MVMRRRFSRRKSNDGGNNQPIEPRWLERAAQAPGLAGATIEPAQPEDVPTDLALVGRVAGEGGDGRIVAVSPHSGGDALLAGIVAASRAAGDVPEVLVFAPGWDAASRRRLGVLAGFEPAPRALVLPPEGSEATAVRAEAVSQALWVAADAIAAQASTAEGRALFARALEALRGLAAKHGGAVRAVGAAAELVIHAKPVATLRAEGSRVLLEVLEPSRSLLPLAESGVSDAMDRLEGSLRKRLNDRRVRDGEEGLRGRWLAPLEAAAGLRFSRRWPFGSAGAAIDLIGVTADGHAVVGAIREEFTLRRLGEVLDATLAAEAWLAPALAAAGSPMRADRPRLALAGPKFDGATQAVLGHLGLSVSCFEGGASDTTLRLLAELDATVATPSERPARGRGAEREDPARGGRGERSPEASSGRGPDRTSEADSGRGPDRSEDRDDAEEGEGEGRSRRRRSRGRRRRGGEPRGNETSEARSDAAQEPESGDRDRGRPRRGRPAAALAEEGTDAEPDSGIDEMSLFDLDDESGDDAEGSRRRRGRGRRGRGGRGGRGRGGEGQARDQGDRSANDGGRDRDARRSAASEDADVSPSGSADDDDLTDDDDDFGLSPDAPDLDEGEVEVVVAYDDEEDEEEPLSELDKQRLAREQRRRARHAAIAPAPGGEGDEESRPTEDVELPRGRAAILAHADRHSIAAAVLLARDIRQVEGIWVYPQEELMTFFRGVATDLREQTPIFVIGFAAKPARDAIQAAALYRGRLVWFDHHEWPPEDLGALKEAIGAGLTKVEPGAGSSLALILPHCSRRSRFSEKLVDLVTGRFTHHDFQRWGRTWWWRLGEIAKRTGERRSDLEMLLAGRPSDLAKEASRSEDAPPPDEFAYVAERDFRLVHFAGLGMVVATLPPQVELHLAMRIARERYGAVLSLARTEGDDLFVLGADDGTGKRAVDLNRMLEHLSQKFAWVVPASDEDHVARFRVRNLAEKPDRLDELVAEIGMGRSVLEG